MSTKVTILGQEKEEAKKVLKPIEFCKYLQNSSLILDAMSGREWSHIELIVRDYADCLDLMFAYMNEDRSENCLYLGHFNDGVV